MQISLKRKKGRATCSSFGEAGRERESQIEEGEEKKFDEKSSQLLAALLRLNTWDQSREEGHCPHLWLQRGEFVGSSGGE